MSCVVERGNFPEFKSGLSVFQVEDRRAGIGGTDAKRIMEGAWRELWMEKTGRAEPEDLYDRFDPVKDRFILKHVTRDSLELSRLMGHVTEPLNRFWFEKQTGRAVTRFGERIVHPDIPFMFANIDGMTVTAKGQPCMWDAKHVNKLDDAVVQRNTPQLIHNALVAGVEHWCQSFLIQNNKWDKVEQEVDPFYASDLLAKEAEFWGYVTRDEEPEDGAALPPPKPVKFREVTIDLENPGSNWEYSILSPVERYIETHKAATSNAIARKEIKEILPDDVGLCRVGLVDLKRKRTGDLVISLARLGGGSDAGA